MDLINKYKFFFILIILINFLVVLINPANHRLKIYSLLVFLGSFLIILKIFYNTPDDLGYLNIYNKSIVGDFVYNISAKDFLWINLSKLINLGVNSIICLYILACIGFLFKSFIIYKSTDFPFESLLLYFVFFYQVHDLTQLRIGFASALFLYSIYLIGVNRLIPSLLFSFSSYLSHSSLITNPIIYLINFNIHFYKYFISFLMILIIMTVFPSADNLIQISGLIREFGYAIPNMFEQYITNDYNHIHDYSDYYPVIYIPLTAFILFFKPKISENNDLLLKYSYSSILLGYLLLWFFSDLYVVGGRFFEFYLVPIIFLVGYIKDVKYQRLLFYTIISLFFMRNILMANYFE